jgi:hypothetical protein
LDPRNLLWSFTAGVVVAAVALAGLWWADSELGLLGQAAGEPGDGALVSLAEPVTTPTADGNGHAVRARVAARLEAGADDHGGSGGHAERVLERATKGALAASTTTALARPAGRRALKRRIIRGARRDGALAVERVYLTEITWS